MNARVLALLLVGVLMIGAVSPAMAAGPAVTNNADYGDCDYPLTVTDATGEVVEIDEPPERIVTTNPSAAQTLWEIGAKEKVVGLTEHALYLDGADEKTLIGDDDSAVVLEKVIDLEPDIVLAPNATSTETVEQMRDAGVTVYHFHGATSIDDVREKTMLIGELADACERAEETVAWMDERLSIVEDAVAGEERPTVLYFFFDFTAGPGTHIHDMIEIAGGENLAAEAGIEWYAPISDEVVIDQDPEWIVMNSNDPALPDSEAFNTTTAVQEDQTIVIDIQFINQPAPGNVHAIEQMVEHFHPDAYAEAVEAAEEEEADDDADVTEDADDSDTTDDADEETHEEDEEEEEEDEDSTLPAPGPAVAAVAIVLTALGLRLRR